eukprot:SAG31_NODE_19979_length_587_cov_0.758197_1_plen_78_part_00
MLKKLGEKICCTQCLLHDACSIGFEKLEVKDASDEKSKVYALMLSDTVVVKPEGNSAEVLTEPAPIKVCNKWICFSN